MWIAEIFCRNNPRQVRSLIVFNKGRIIVAKSQVTLRELSRIYLEAIFSISSLLRVGTTFKSYYLRISQRLGVNFAQQD